MQARVKQQGMAEVAQKLQGMKTVHMQAMEVSKEFSRRTWENDRETRAGGRKIGNI